MAGVKGTGGKKGRSGRKPKAFTLLRRRIEAEKSDDAEYAFALYSEVMHDPKQPVPLRLECADWIAKRVLGNPKDKREETGELVIRIERERNKPDATRTASGTTANQG